MAQGGLAFKYLPVAIEPAAARNPAVWLCSADVGCTALDWLEALAAFARSSARDAHETRRPARTAALARMAAIVGASFATISQNSSSCACARVARARLLSRALRLSRALVSRERRVSTREIYPYKSRGRDRTRVD